MGSWENRQLLPEDGPWHGRHSNWVAVEQLVTHLEGQHLPEAPPEDEWYGWEPLPVVDFLEGIALAGQVIQEPARRFLDVGSGIGTKLFLAQALGWDATGIERHRPYVHISYKLFGDPPAVSVQWAEEFSDYGNYDLVYCYRLARAEKDQDQLNRHIVEHMKPGALFFCVGPPWPVWLEHVGGSVWRK